MAIVRPMRRMSLSRKWGKCLIEFMSAKTITKSERLNWLVEHPEVWWGFAILYGSPMAKPHDKRIFEAMQEAELFSQSTQCCGITIKKLVDQARFVLALKQLQPKPENN